MPIPSLRVTIVMVTIFLCACNRNIVSLNYTNATGEVQQLNNLIFRFDKPLVPDSLLNRWDTSEYVLFEPKISGRFRWEHPDELVFSPSRPLPPATTFTAFLGGELLQYAKYDVVNKKDKITFSTPALKLENTYITWVTAGEKSAIAFPQVDLHFNYSVNPEMVKEKLHLLIDGSKADYTITTLSKDNKITLRINNLKPTEKDLQASVQLEKGVIPEGGTNGTPQEMAMDVLIPSPYNLAINDFTSEHDGTDGTILVHTSQLVVMDDIRSHISITPAIKYTVEETEDGFSITSSNFDVAKSYLVTLKKGLRGKIGGTLREQYDNSVAFGELEPALSFTNNKSVYLSSKGSRQLEVSITNIEKVKVIISKIYESNILAAHRYGYSPADSRNANDESEEDYYEESGGDLTLGEVVYEQEIDTRSLPKNGNHRIFRFDPEDRLPEFKGIYHIKLRSTKNYWLSDSRFISLSDIGLIARESRDRVVVVASSIGTALQLDGVQVAVYGNNNQVLGLGTTNKEGVADIGLTRKQFAGFRPAMIIARTADDFNYLPFNTTRVNTSRFEVGGKKSNASGLDAFIYAERDIYRPGELVNFSVVLRDRQWKSPGELPVKLKFLQPNGKELKNFRKTLNEQGSLEAQVEISGAAITGNYTLEVYSSNDVLLGSKNFNIEEFVPDRIKVNATLDLPTLQPGQTGHLSISALNFFGPPAANRNYETEIQVKPISFSPKKFERFTFSIQNPALTFDKVVDEGKTDENGKATASYAVPEEFKNKGILQASFYATVFDETGRPVSRNVTADIYTQNTFFGIGSDGYNYYALNQAVRFPLVALDRSEKILNGAVANVKVIKREYRTNLVKNGNYFRYESVQDDKLISEQQVTISGENYSYSFVPRTAGEYELRVSLPGASGYVNTDFYSYGSWGSNNASFE
ncbi:MAG TPA: MG2 domain-containing protein, partial [Flavitalea sp.]|nr:MG2 domain-containing protein [Flavitalea sp.]